MDTGRTRRELGRSLRLPLAEERWLPAALLAAAVGYPIWLAGTGTAVTRLAEAAVGPVSMDPWRSGATALAAVFALLWVVLPAIVAVKFVTDRLTNLRGNVEQHYRFRHPSLLLVPPVALLAMAVALGAARGVTWQVVVALGIAGAFFLLRTAAYGYRVFSFSRPRALQAMVLVAAIVACVAVATRTAPLIGQGDVVEGLAAQYGASNWAFGAISRAGFTVPALPFAAAATPVVLGTGYVALQLLASLVVRVRKPDVPRSSIRAGQRYPAVVHPGDPGSASTSSDPSVAAGADGSGADASEADGSGSTVEQAGERAASANGDATTADDDPASGTETSQPAAAGDSGGDDETDSGEDDGDDADTVGHTRVFTPPGDGEGFDAPEDPGTDTADDQSASAVDGSTQVVEDAADACAICGESLDPDADRTHCPNCNALLDDA